MNQDSLTCALLKCGLSVCSHALNPHADMRPACTKHPCAYCYTVTAASPETLLLLSHHGCLLLILGVLVSPPCKQVMQRPVTSQFSEQCLNANLLDAV
jgi:hypothetical protein